ncbi:MAG: glycosyltransferase [Planctomycetota bacterium]
MHEPTRKRRIQHPEELPIAFLGTYPPRRCGIATFTRDLSDAMIAANEGVRATILAVTDVHSAHEQSERVRFEIRQGVSGDYSHAAEFVNFSDIQLVSIQHEYGIFGGADGAYVLDFLGELGKPAIATLHTVLEDPAESQREIVLRMAERCERLVVMSQLAVELLESSYGIPRSLTAMIPHGIPDMAAGERDEHKARFGVPSRRVLLTFGLLNPSKGIDVVIRALPGLVESFPDLVYLVVGATHPEVKRRNGEEYRNSLRRLAESLGIADNVVFRNQFVDIDELCGYLQAADVYITPYLCEAQIASGTLAYAMGSGAAVVSTPYWYAKELLAEGRGRLFGVGDVEGLTSILGQLLTDEEELVRLQRSAYAFGRQMIWQRVGTVYERLARDVLRDAVAPATRPANKRSLPELRLDHLIRMTDDTGLLQHAIRNVPDRNHGYCVDDNSRGLVVALLAQQVIGTPETDRLITTYLSYLHYSQSEDGRFCNFMDYRRNLDRDSGSEDCTGRSLWALGTAVLLGPNEGHRSLARDLFDRGVGRALEFGPRGCAFAILGLGPYLDAHPGEGAARTLLHSLGQKLITRYEEQADEGWHWFEPKLTYENALLPLALFELARRDSSEKALRIARESLAFLEQTCFSQDHLTLIGNSGWYERGAERSVSDEQPVDAAAFVMAFRAAYAATGDRRYLHLMRVSFEWFLGANRLKLPLYDFSTAGCRDGLGEHGLNENQGAESLVSFLLALLAMYDLGSNELDGERVLNRATCGSERDDYRRLPRSHVTVKNGR